jgi:hypothetical protein
MKWAKFLASDPSMAVGYWQREDATKETFKLILLIREKLTVFTHQEI